MTLTQQIYITVAMVVLGTAVTRFLPFLVFPAGRPTPKYICYLGRVLPCAVFGLLVIYSLKDVSIATGSHGIPELISILLVVALHVCEAADAPVHCRWGPCAICCSSSWCSDMLKSCNSLHFSLDIGRGVMI